MDLIDAILCLRTAITGSRTEPNWAFGDAEREATEIVLERLKKVQHDLDRALASAKYWQDQRRTVAENTREQAAYIVSLGENPNAPSELVRAIYSIPIPGDENYV